MLTFPSYPKSIVGKNRISLNNELLKIVPSSSSFTLTVTILVSGCTVSSTISPFSKPLEKNLFQVLDSAFRICPSSSEIANDYGPQDSIDS